MTMIKSGDLVVLRSGGPVMTVDTVNTDIFDDAKVTGVLCAWFDGDKLARVRFDPATLVPAPVVAQPAPTAAPLAAAVVEEVVGDYADALDSMADAMNGASDDAVPKPTKPALRKPARKPRRADIHAPFGLPS